MPHPSELLEALRMARQFLSQRAEMGEREIPLSDLVWREPPSKTERLEALYQASKDCQKCPLGRLRTRFVFGSGDPEAGIMFIGEAPGRDEDLQGEPFVGRAGQLLTRIVEAMGLRRGDVYIANLLKCRPPNNRDPEPVEIETCHPYLLSQIQIIQPKIICALGRIAGQALLKTNAPMSALRGKVWRYGAAKLIVTYHPAALLRNSQWKRPTWEDMKMLRREYDGVEL